MAFVCANIFQVSRFWSLRELGDPREDPKSKFGHYMFWTWEVLYGVWEDSSTEDINLMYLMNIFFMFITVLYFLILANTLIAVVCRTFNKNIENIKTNDTKLKLEMVVKILILKHWIYMCWENKDFDYSWIYILIDANEKPEQLNEDQRDAQIGEIGGIDADSGETCKRLEDLEKEVDRRLGGFREFEVKHVEEKIAKVEGKVHSVEESIDKLGVLVGKLMDMEGVRN